MLYLTNTFDLQMLDFSLDPAGAPSVQFKVLSYFEAMEALDGGFVAAVGTGDTAMVLEFMDLPEPTSRVSSVVLGRGDSLIVAQYSAPQRITFIRCNINYW